MVYADASTVIQRDVSWSRGMRIIPRGRAVDLTEWTFTAKIISAAGQTLHLLTGEITAEDCILFTLAHELTNELTPQTGRWEVWGLRSDNLKVCFVKGRATII